MFKYAHRFFFFFYILLSLSLLNERITVGNRKVTRDPKGWNAGNRGSELCWAHSELYTGAA